MSFEERGVEFTGVGGVYWSGRALLEWVGSSEWEGFIGVSVVYISFSFQALPC